MCGKSLKSACTFSRHKRKHIGKLFICKTCGKVYKTKTYEKHLAELKHHGSEDPSLKTAYNAKKECFVMQKWRRSFESVCKPTVSQENIPHPTPRFEVIAAKS